MLLACVFEWVTWKSWNGFYFFSINVKSYNKTVSTGNLMRHLRDEHKIRSDEDVAKARSNIKQFFSIDRFSKSGGGPGAGASCSKTNNPPMRTTDKWLLARDLALWFCKSLMPFDSVGDEGMIDFFKVSYVFLLSYSF